MVSIQIKYYHRPAGTPLLTLMFLIGYYLFEYIENFQINKILSICIVIQAPIITEVQ